ncbi:MAG: hypothetical protein R3199_07370 [Gemmatimonadota bacterium]|nr:hypothetical protein [Gemmatimonadota bacterium]
MGRSSRFPFIVTVVAFLLCSGLFARVSGQEVESEEAIPAASLLQAAEDLARSGIEYGDARAVVAAAELMILATPADPRVDTGEPVPPREVGGVDLDPRSLLYEATRIAAEAGDHYTAMLARRVAADTVLGFGDPALADSLRRAGPPWPRGAVGGPVRKEGLLLEGRPETVRIEFEGGYRPNGIFVTSPDPLVDLDCTLQVDGEEIARDAGVERSCRFGWKQRVVREVTVRIEHVGGTTRYLLLTN